jgi:hypothetical protein
MMHHALPSSMLGSKGAVACCNISNAKVRRKKHMIEEVRGEPPYTPNSNETNPKTSCITLFDIRINQINEILYNKTKQTIHRVQYK